MMMIAVARATIGGVVVATVAAPVVLGAAGFGAGGIGAGTVAAKKNKRSKKNRRSPAKENSGGLNTVVGAAIGGLVATFAALCCWVQLASVPWESAQGPRLLQRSPRFMVGPPPVLSPP